MARLLNKLGERPSWLTALLTLLVTVPPLTVWAIVVYFDIQWSYDRAASANLTTARMAAQLVKKATDDTFHHMRGHAKELIGYIAADDEANVKEELKEMLFSSATIGSIALYDPGGKGVIHMVIPGRMSHPGLICPNSKDMDWSGEPWFRDYQASGKKTTISGVYYDPCEPGIPNVALVSPLKHGQRTVGVLRIVFDMPAISEWFEPIKLPGGMSLAIVDQHRRLIYDSTLPVQAWRTGKATAAVKHVGALLNATRNAPNSLAVPGADGEEIAASAGVRGSRWTVVSRQSLSIINRPIVKHIIELSFAIALLIALGLFLVTQIVRSYRKQRDLSEKLSQALDKESGLKNELAESVKDLSVINEITADINKELDIGNLLQRLTRHTAKLLRSQASVCFLWLDGEFPAHAATFNLPADCAKEAKRAPKPAGGFLESDQAVIANDCESMPLRLESFVKAGVKSAAMMPMTIGSLAHGVLGSLTLGQEDRKYTERDLTLLQSVAGQAEITLENAILHDQTVTVAETLQKSFLPINLPDVSG